MGNFYFPLIVLLVFGLFFGGKAIYRRIQERKKKAELATLIGEIGILIAGFQPPDQWGSVRVGACAPGLRCVRGRANQGCDS